MASSDETKRKLNENEKDPDDLDETPVKGTFCPKCGTENIAGAQFCENCGHNLIYIPPSISEKDSDKGEDEIEPKKKSSSLPMIIIICGGVFFVLIFIIIIAVASLLIYQAYFSSSVGIESGQDVNMVRNTVTMALNWFLK